jgi:hypothetical protein
MSLFSPLTTALSPYTLWLKIGAAIALVLAVFFFFGWHEKGLRDDKIIRDKDAQITALHVSLDAAAVALNQVNAETARQVTEAKKNEKLAREAEVLAHQAAADIATKTLAYEARMAQARKKATCDALLNMDIAKECGL